MKAYLEQLLIPDDEIFIIKRNQMSHFTTPRHYHRELEIKFMVEGKGKGFIGESIYDYNKNNLVLVGPNLPHHWESDRIYHDGTKMADCVYIQFREECFGYDFLSKTNNLLIGQLFDRARWGILFSENISIEAASLINELWLAHGVSKTILFLRLLHLLANTYEYSLITTSGSLLDRHQGDKLHKIHTYIIQNFRHGVSIDVAASLAHMSKSAFCQYFKKRTMKNFSSFVIEVRLANVVKILLEKEKGISEACYESGFTNISYFNRKFLEVYKCSPREYLKNFTSNKI